MIILGILDGGSGSYDLQIDLVEKVKSHDEVRSDPMSIGKVGT